MFLYTGGHNSQVSFFCKFSSVTKMSFCGSSSCWPPCDKTIHFWYIKYIVELKIILWNTSYLFQPDFWVAWLTVRSKYMKLSLGCHIKLRLSLESVKIFSFFLGLTTDLNSIKSIYPALNHSALSLLDEKPNFVWSPAE